MAPATEPEVSNNNNPRLIAGKREVHSHPDLYTRTPVIVHILRDRGGLLGLRQDFTDMSINYTDTDQTICPGCSGKRTNIERVLDGGLGGARSYVCEAGGCQLALNLSIIDTWRVVSTDGETNS